MLFIIHKSNLYLKKQPEKLLIELSNKTNDDWNIGLVNVVIFAHVIIYSFFKKKV